MANVIHFYISFIYTLLCVSAGYIAYSSFGISNLISFIAASNFLGICLLIHYSVTNNTKKRNAYMNDNRNFKTHEKTIFENHHVSEIKHAIKEDNVEMFTQPFYKIPQRLLAGYEAYARLKLADGTTIMPEEFLGIAERDNLIELVDIHMLFRILKLIKIARSREFDITFFCNISHTTMEDEGFFQNIYDFATNHPDLTKNLVLELEYEKMKLWEHHVCDHIERLAWLGIGFSVDNVTDLNLKFSSLEKCNVRWAKINTVTFEENLDNGNALQDFKKEAKKNNINIIITKIETENQLLDALDYNFEFGQGNFFSSPMKRDL